MARKHRHSGGGRKSIYKKKWENVKDEIQGLNFLIEIEVQPGNHHEYFFFLFVA